MGLFDENMVMGKVNYPWAKEFIQAFWDSPWNSSLFNFKSDIQQFKTEMTEEERQMTVRAITAIAQVEVAVKRFWGQLGDKFNHHELYDLGYAMANSEVVHSDAYAKLLEKLNLQKSFEENLNSKELNGRINYLRKYLNKVYENDRQQQIYSLILFTLFTENVSLFSQFYILLYLRRFKNYLKDTAQQINYTKTEETCFEDTTEILTPQGWRLISDMRIGDDVYQYTKDGTLERTLVLNTIKKHFNGNLIKFSRQSNECVVTPDHRMIYFDDKDNLREKTAEELKIHKFVKFPICAEYTGGNNDILTPLERIYIAIQADGTKTYWINKDGEKISRGKDGGYNYTVQFKKKRKIERFRHLLNQVNIKYTEKYISDREYVRFTLVLDQDYDYKTFDWVNLTNKTSIWCKEFINEIINWDGWKYRESNAGYDSKIKENVNIVEHIAILAGYVTKRYDHKDNRSENYSTMYRVSFRTANPKPHSHGIKKELVSYDGDVVCVTVPSGMILTKHNNKPFITGNCHANIGIKLINTLKIEYPELFTNDLEQKIIEEVNSAVEAESKIIDWIVGDFSDNEHLTKDILKNFIKNRINISLKDIGINYRLHVNLDLLEKSEWFDEDVKGNSQVDFFHSRPIDYSRNNQSFDLDELFD